MVSTAKDLSDKPAPLGTEPSAVNGDIVAAAYSRHGPRNLDAIKYGDNTAPKGLTPAPEITSAFATTPGDHRLQQNGRDYEAHIPKDYDGHSPLKVMFVFHGYEGSIKEMKAMTRLNEYADERKFAVVYLQALKKPVPGTLGLFDTRAWNTDHGIATIKDPSYNDMDYIKPVVETVSKGLNVADPKKDVFFAGYSEGGMVAQFVGQQLPCAGIATVDSTILTSDPRPQPGGDPKKFIAILGNDDNFLPIYGGHGWFSQWRPLKGFMTITLPHVSESVPLDQAKVWSAAEGDTQSETITDKHNITTKYTGGIAPVEQIIHQSHFYDWWIRGGMHEWNANQKKGWWGLREADPSQNDSTTILDFFGM